MGLIEISGDVLCVFFFLGGGGGAGRGLFFFPKFKKTIVALI